MDNSGSSTSQWFNVQVEEEFYKNVNVFTVQKSTKKLVDLSVKSKKPIPSPRFVHENKSLELDSKLSFQNTGAVKKLSNQLSNESNSSIQSQNSSDNPQSPKSPKTPEENDEVTLKRSSSIYKSFKRLFVSKRHRKHRKNQPSSPITPESATPEELADYDVKLRPIPMVDPPNYNDTIKESNLEDQRRFQEICKRISGRISTRLEGATAPTFEDEEDKLFYANIDMAMKAHLNTIINMRSTLKPKKPTVEQALSMESKISSLTREILDEFDPCRVKKSHTEWLDKLCAYFSDIAADIETEFPMKESYYDVNQP